MSRNVYDMSDSTEIITGHLPSNIGLTPEMILKAKEELNETPSKKEDALEELRKLIREEQDFLPVMDDSFLVRFLRVKKFDAGKAFKTLKNYYTYKLRYSGKITDIVPSEIEHIIRMDILTILPHRDSEGSLVGIAKLGGLDFNKVTTDQLLAGFIIAAETVLQSEATQVCGVVMIGDFTGLTLRCVRHLGSPRVIYRFFRAIQDCIPLRVKVIHITNEPFYFSIIFNVVKRFRSEKMKERFQLHGSNFERLHTLLPPEMLPEEIGGHQGPMDSKYFAKIALGTDNYFLKLSKYGYGGPKADYIRRKSSFNIGLFE